MAFGITLSAMEPKADSKLRLDAVSVRDVRESDIPMILNYWFRSPPGYLEEMGVDPAKMPTEAGMEKMLREKVDENKKLPSSKLSAVIICYDGQAIGMHTINQLVEGDHGIFHAHICNPEFRRRGLGMLSYPKACRIFIDRFNLKRIVFKTPVGNIGPIRVKEKLGIRQIGEEVIGFGITKDNTPAKVFELTREEIDQRWPK
jgi:RimJ/RimL family protein N-acetyltransferase